MKQTIEIEVPDGKKAVWKDNKVIFEDIKPQLPKTWEEFCKQNKKIENEYYLDNLSCIVKAKIDERHECIDRNILPNKQAAETHLALMQLHQLRDCYRQGWEPNWEENYNKYVIVKSKDEYRVFINNWTRHFLAFQDGERTEEFLTNFRELIEQAGDLI
jgi:hypothetical protein